MRVKKVEIHKNSYYDSVKLMAVNKAVSSLQGVRQAAVFMGTPHNRELLKEAGLDLPETHEAGPGDLIIALEVEGESAWKEAQKCIEEELSPRAASPGTYRPRTLEGAIKQMPGANLALISLPGDYAAAEAHLALDRGLHVMLFSDNVSLEEEITLKEKARGQGLLLMGPDCGTALIGGAPLGFANNLKAGPVGIVAAAGTGAQEVSTLLHQRGIGVSHILGTGGRDLQDEVGGITMLQGIAALENDPATEILVLISKPPGKETEKKLEAEIKKNRKPVITVFLGSEIPDLSGGAQTLEEGANKVIQLLNEEKGSLSRENREEELAEEILIELPPLNSEQRYLRGLFTGGTLCYEALLILNDWLQPLYSNTPLEPGQKLENPRESQAHTCVDLGEDLFTRGRAHPMIDPEIRLERINQEVQRGDMAVLLLDLVLGYGAHQDPAGSLAPVLEEAQKKTREKGGHLRVVTSICGTAEDPQDYEQQKKKLEQVGAVVAPSNAAAVRMAARLCPY